eukprot:TRINITY_DN59820_c0_g1_i2.p1 TRINITY_DN59820_c0_g1~~TRINITY_DN59820_c0_g1_i2.p1  ORF type:complete len:812 (-),score=100.37 TRINITY_DN59820_c0_g1_i2:484-2919(-)
MEEGLLENRLATIDELSKKEPDDPKNMFENKYAARTQLQQVLGDLRDIYASTSISDPQRKLCVGQLAIVYIELGSNMIDCKETSEGKELLDVAQEILEASRNRKYYSYEEAAQRKAEKEAKAKKKKEEIEKYRQAAKAAGKETTMQKDASWLPEREGDYAPAEEEFPIPTTFNDPDYTHVDILLTCYNLLALQWSKWGEELKAKLLLENAEKIYENWAANSPVKMLRETHAAEVAASSTTIADVISDFKSEAECVKAVRDEEQNRQKAILQEKLRKKRMRKKGAATSEQPTTEDKKSSVSTTSPERCTTSAASDSETETKASSSTTVDDTQLSALERKRAQLLEKEKILKQKEELVDKIDARLIRQAQQMDKQNALTCFLLAQIFMATDKFEQAAQYFQATLNRQLKIRQFDRVDWAENCSWLANYYIEETDLCSSEHCLLAAELILPKDGKTEIEPRITKQLTYLWARYYQRWLKVSCDICRDSEKPEKERDENLPYSVDKHDVLRFKRDKCKAPQVRFHRLPIPQPNPCLPLLSTSSQAKKVFTKAVERYEEVMDFFNIHDWTEHRIALMQELSALYEAFSYYEVDDLKRLELHLKRIPVLEDPIEHLGNIIFTNTLRQFNFELGTVHQTVIDLKLALKKSGQLDCPDAEINEWVGKATVFFETFCQSFKKEWEQIEKVKKEEDRSTEFLLDEDYCPAYLMGQIHQAQLCTKRISATEEEWNQNIEKAVTLYNDVLVFARKCKIDKKKKFKDELALCKEMVQLLPGAKRGEQIKAVAKPAASPFGVVPMQKKAKPKAAAVVKPKPKQAW